MLRRRITVLGVLAMSAVFAGPAHAQDPWSGEISVGTSLFFGNTSAYNLTASAGIARSDSTAEVSASGRAAYGEATSGGTKFVLRRAWEIRAAADYKPESRFSPFLFGTVERSLQARIDARQSGGVGVKFVFHREGATRFDFSPALLAERTDPRLDTPSPDEIDAFVRWSFRLRGRHQLSDDRVRLSAVLFYRPKFDDTGVYTLEVDASLDIAITTRLALRVAYLDRYDSEAVERGALSNNDGQVIIGLTTNF